MSDPWPIPRSWAWTRTESIAAIVGGGTPDTQRNDYFGGDIAWLTPADLSGYTAKRVAGGARSLTNAGYQHSGAQMLPAGAVVFSSRAPIGYVAIAACSICTNQGFKSFVPEPGISSDYLYYYLHRAKPLAVELASGTTFLEISGRRAAVLPVPVPSLSEQKRIAEKLDELLSDLDAGVTALERVQTKLKHYRSAVLKAAVGGTLTTEWRRQNPASEPGSELLKRILAERRRRWEEVQLKKFKDTGKSPPKHWESKYSEPASPHVTDVPPLPEGWCWVSLDQLLYEIEAGKSFECVPRPAQADEWGIIKVSAMSWGAFDENENKTVPATRAINPHYAIRPGDILLSRANTYELVGASVLVNQCRPRLLLSDKSMRLIYNSQVDRLWLKTMLSSPWVRRQLSRKSTGTKEGMRNVSQESVLNVLLPLAPARECIAIVEAVEDQLSVIEHLELDLENKLKSAQALRQSILRHAFTGQLVPQDPNDEPASELLKRIATERVERARLMKAAKLEEPKTKTPRGRAARD